MMGHKVLALAHGGLLTMFLRPIRLLVHFRSDYDTIAFKPLAAHPTKSLACRISSTLTHGRCLGATWLPHTGSSL